MFHWQPRPAHPQLPATDRCTAESRRVVGGWMGEKETGWLTWWGGKQASIRSAPGLTSISINNLANNPSWSVPKRSGPSTSAVAWRDYTTWRQQSVAVIVVRLLRNSKQLRELTLFTNRPWIKGSQTPLLSRFKSRLNLRSERETVSRVSSSRQNNARVCESSHLTSSLCTKQTWQRLVTHATVSEFICPAIIYVWECTRACPRLPHGVKYYFAEMGDKGLIFSTIIYTSH